MRSKLRRLSFIPENIGNNIRSFLAEISWAYATRRCESIAGAQKILLDALAKHPDEAMISYNLACYACQMEDIDGAKEYLEQAFTLAPQIRSLALEDEDLQPLWNSL